MYKLVCIDVDGYVPLDDREPLFEYNQIKRIITENKGTIITQFDSKREEFRDFRHVFTLPFIEKNQRGYVMYFVSSKSKLINLD
ncbi:hypothetical protein [Rossellomorea aquimaris]|jgi:hypothetical protein|uniref:Uncharacterized protein n=1 Tax=Rossellomorea aquimaris TaxID=189382 RepID=A0A5D4U1Z6_9BACI|nr:hypothetical protein [Rossellomorea aquimaris]TYS75919.1 hypothetical protein FZD05_19535 [Rossellomorea aquimaris]TYS81179.1 hypothetical protein FZC85_20110 [Rossellomorea aquimaris]